MRLGREGEESRAEGGGPDMSQRRRHPCQRHHGGRTAQAGQKVIMDHIIRI